MDFMTQQEYDAGIRRVLISEEELQEAIRKAGAAIDKEYAGKPMLFVSILKGAFVFLADLMRAVSIHCEVGFMQAQSYFDGTESKGEVEITLDLQQDIRKYHVIIVEDIIDTGRTLSLVAAKLRERDPLSLKIVTLLDKPERRVVPLDADYSLFTIPDYFVIGYGLDLGEYYRNLPYIAEYNIFSDNEKDA
ncbi:MAG: hypoxanthine phosphoribosyltransferase [Oscillospiraceae bacterium]|nr:hypoxanthine phosphoribosyltransferase [Oscillospiraceae bacterium]